MEKFNSLKLWNLTLVMKNVIMKLNEKSKLTIVLETFKSNQKNNAGRLLYM